MSHNRPSAGTAANAEPATPLGDSHSSRSGFSANRMIVLAYASGGLSVIVHGAGHDPRSRFHGYQALVYLLAVLVGYAVMSILSNIFGPFIKLYEAAAVVFWGFQLWRAYNGSPLSLPVLANVARKLAAPAITVSSDTVQ